MAAALAGASFVLVLIVYQRVIGLENRIARLSRLDAKLDAVLKHLEIDFNPSEGISDEIIEALKRGDKIQAIKLHREANDVSLREAKEFIKELQRRGDFAT